MRAILAGGGTGGHVIPALAIAGELRDRYAADVVFIGTSRGLEKRLVPAAGFTLKLVEIGQLKNVSLATRARTLLALPHALFQAASLIREFRPQVVIGVGGYASGPGMLAAALAGVPTLAFEPNYVPGLANRLVAPMITTAAVQFPETGRAFRKSVVTGIPVRREFFRLPPRPPNAPPTLLVFGGSQGARAINRAIVEALPGLHQSVPGMHIIHQTGERDYDVSQAGYLRSGISAELHAFIDDMPAMFARADLVICRSGASTVAEIAAAGKPAIFIPFPRAADDHQLRNAEALARDNGAVVVRESDLTRERLIELVASLLKDRARRAAIGAAARAHAHPGAGGNIAALAARLAGLPT